jgi:hypothetical protein
MLTPAFTTGDDYGPAPQDEWHACGYEEWHESGSYGDTRLVPAFAVAPVVAVFRPVRRAQPHRPP